METTVANINLVGGRLCLDFVNTIARPPGGEPENDRLGCAEDLVHWGRRVGLFDAAAAARFLATLDAYPNHRDSLTPSARALREALWALFVGARGQKQHLDVLSAHLTSHEPLKLTYATGRFAVASPSLARAVLGSVAASAVELLTCDRRDRVKACQGDDCGWLFLDESPSGRRRWCSMAICGNRHKVRKHYANTKSKTK